MNSRLLKSAAALAILSLAAALAALIWVYRSGHSQLIGNLVFAETAAEEAQIKEIIIRTPEQSITLVPDNNFWHIKEADYYYANFDIVRSLFKNFQESRFTGKQTATPQLITDFALANPYKETANAGISISIIGSNGHEYNHVIIGKKNSDDITRYMRIPSLPDIFTVSGQFALPDNLASWLQQPLLSLEAKDLQALKVGDIAVSRKEPIQPFIVFANKHPVRLAKLDQLQRQIVYLNFDSVISAQNFDDTRYPNRRNLQFTTFAGLVYQLNLFSDNQEYWLKLTLSTTALPTTETNDYIKNNAFLYDGWFFKLPESTGRVLYQYQL